MLDQCPNKVIEYFNIQMRVCDLNQGLDLNEFSEDLRLILGFIGYLFLNS